MDRQQIKKVIKVIKVLTKNKKSFSALISAVFICIVLIIGLIGSSLNTSTVNQDGEVQGINEPSFPVTNIVDGDTIKIDYEGREETIRLIGIDTPETVHPNGIVECFGVEASERMKKLVEGKRVRLIPDETQGNTDRYGRMLRYVYLEDGNNVNLNMVLNGFAYEYTYQTPYEFQSEFKAAQEYAERTNSGLWGAECGN